MKFVGGFSETYKVRASFDFLSQAIDINGLFLMANAQAIARAQVVAILCAIFGICLFYVQLPEWESVRAAATTFSRRGLRAIWAVGVSNPPAVEPAVLP